MLSSKKHESNKRNSALSALILLEQSNSEKVICYRCLRGFNLAATISCICRMHALTPVPHSEHLFLLIFRLCFMLRVPRVNVHMKFLSEGYIPFIWSAVNGYAESIFGNLICFVYLQQNSENVIHGITTDVDLPIIFP